MKKKGTQVPNGISKEEYNKIHKWIKKVYGKANRCENCESIFVSHTKHYEWAKLKGKKYEQKRENFWQLCKSCHRKYDVTEQTRLKLSNGRKGMIFSLATRKKMSIFRKGRKRSEKDKLSIREGWYKVARKHLYKGEWKCLAEWCKILNLPKEGTIHKRIFQLNWPVKKAFETVV
jgi:hypothetical protein